MRRVFAFPLLMLFAVSGGCGKKPNAPAPGGSPPANPTSEPPSRDDLKAAQGEWQLTSFQNPDQREYLPDEIERVKGATFKVDGNLLKVTGGGESVTLLIRVDQAKSPREIDLVRTDASGKPLVRKFFTSGGKEQQEEVPPSKGIYKLDGDTLTVAFSNRTQFRPTEFKAATVENTGPPITVNKKASSLVFVAELKRVKK